MKAHATTAVLAMLAAASSAPAQRAPAKAANDNPFAGDEQASAEGRQIFNRACTACHGYDGTTGDRAPALGDTTRRYLRTTDRQLFDAIEKGIPNSLMPPTGLSESDAWKVASYVRGLRATARDAPAKGNLEHGEQVFWGKGGCGACHMLRGKGGLMGPDLSDIAGQRQLSLIRNALTSDKNRYVFHGGAHDRNLVPLSRYQSVRIVTGDGQTVTGVLRNEDDYTLQVLGADSVLHVFKRAGLRELTYEQKSSMPSDYDKRLTPDEFQDLLAFLSRQSTR